jgi:hypothetical protein
MAIIVEEEKKGSRHMFSLVGWVVFLLIAAAAVYYIFFASAPAVVLPSTGSLSAIAPLTQSAVQPQDVENSAALQALHTTVAVPTSTGPASVTRPNPFLAP